MWTVGCCQKPGIFLNFRHSCEKQMVLAEKSKLILYDSVVLPSGFLDGGQVVYFQSCCGVDIADEGK